MLFGHEDKIETFKKLASEGNLSHAYLFFGDAGIGKFTFAKSLICFLELNKFEIRDEPLLDFSVIRPNEKGVIGIDAVREIRAFLWQTPFRSPKRVVIIDDSHSLTLEAQSAFLKIVEEPPRDSMLIFIASSDQFFFPPLLSRLIKIYFRRFSAQKIEEVLIKHFSVPSDKAKEIARDSFGRLGRALVSFRNVDQRVDFAEEIEEELSKKILDLRKRNLFSNASILKWLLEKEMALKRLNLSKALQKKAIQNKINSS